MFTEVLIHGSTPSRPDQIVSSATYQVQFSHSNTRSRIQVLKSRDSMFHALHSFAVRDGEPSLTRQPWFNHSTFSRYPVSLGRPVSFHTTPINILYRAFWSIQRGGRPRKAVDRPREALHGVDHYLRRRRWWFGRPGWEPCRGTPRAPKGRILSEMLTLQDRARAHVRRRGKGTCRAVRLLQRRSGALSRCPR